MQLKILTFDLKKINYYIIQDILNIENVF